MTAIVKSTANDKLAMANALANANLLPRAYQKNPANLLFAMEYADAIGVHPMTAIQSIHVIDGKPSACWVVVGSAHAGRCHGYVVGAPGKGRRCGVGSWAVMGGAHDMLAPTHTHTPILYIYTVYF